ncbi:MAG TPA: hypothetical protein VFB63_27525 [Bryobacteraceae bacterium]|nr:hypothetical protein [Bryobacteraceae bacterium]
MGCTTWQTARKLVVLLLVGATACPAAGSDTLKARVRRLHEQGAEVKVVLLDGSTDRGRVVRVDADSFALRKKADGQERALPYAEVKDVTRSGLSRRAKAILIPAAIGGGVLLVLCAGPYPIGFLCRKDPS